MPRRQSQLHGYRLRIPRRLGLGANDSARRAIDRMLARKLRASGCSSPGAVAPAASDWGHAPRPLWELAERQLAQPLAWALAFPAACHGLTAASGCSWNAIPLLAGARYRSTAPGPPMAWSRISGSRFRDNLVNSQASGPTGPGTAGWIRTVAANLRWVQGYFTRFQGSAARIELLTQHHHCLHGAGPAHAPSSRRKRRDPGLADLSRLVSWALAEKMWEAPLAHLTTSLRACPSTGTSSGWVLARGYI